MKIWATDAVRARSRFWCAPGSSAVNGYMLRGPNFLRLIRSLRIQSCAGTSCHVSGRLRRRTVKFWRSMRSAPAQVTVQASAGLRAHLSQGCSCSWPSHLAIKNDLLKHSVDFREEAHRSQELRYLGSLPVPHRLPQHVQGVQGSHFERCNRADVHGDGLQAPCALTSASHHQDHCCQGCGLQACERHPVPQFPDQVPCASQVRPHHTAMAFRGCAILRPRTERMRAALPCGNGVMAFFSATCDQLALISS
jgi:hypothetical protein